MKATQEVIGMSTNSTNTILKQQNLATITPSLPMPDYRTLNPIGHQVTSPQYVSATCPMKRIVIIGSSGSGKSTLARQLGKQLNLPVFHLDRYYWQPGWVEMPEAQWNAKIASMVSFDSWIIDGNYRDTLDVRINRADSVIFMDLHPFICSWRAIKRRIVYRNRPRPDMAAGCVEKLFDPQLFEFIRHIWQYPYRAKPDVAENLNAISEEKRVVWLRSKSQVKNFTQSPLDYPAYIPDALLF